MRKNYRPYIDKTHPEVYRSLLKTMQLVKEAAAKVEISEATLELVNTRVSQINGCVTCLSIHIPAARKAGITQTQLDVLDGWRESKMFSELDEAALYLAETYTVIDKTTNYELVGKTVAQRLTPEQIGVLEWTISLINAFNRVSIASGHPVIQPRGER